MQDSTDSIDKLSTLLDKYKEAFSLCDRLSEMENNETIVGKTAKFITEELKEKRDKIMTILEATVETLNKEMDEVQSGVSMLTTSTIENAIQQIQASATHENDALPEESNGDNGNKRRKTDETSNEFEKTVYVTNVDKDALVEDVKAAFENKYGPVSSVRLHGITPLRKIAYVVFQSTKDADIACTQTSDDDFKVKGRKVNVKPYRSKKPDGCKQIYCGDCLESTSKDDVRNAFKDCGDINQVKRHGNAWLVLFHEEEAVDKAVAMNEKCLFGNDIKTRVDYDKSKM